MTNIAEILKDAPRGLKLYSLVHGEVTLNEIILNNKYPVRTICSIGSPSTFTKHGKFIKDLEEDAECILFPSKEHKSWDNWQDILFQIGDIVTNNITHRSFIITNYNTHELIDRQGSTYHNKFVDYEYATPEERDQFFKELNTNGYTWNDNTKQMEKIEQRLTPKYKVGDWLYDNNHGVIQITDIIGGNDGLYCFNNECQNLISLTDKFSRFATEQELIDAGIKEKPFTIDDLKPFDKVLTRNHPDGTWYVNYYSHKDKSGYVCVVGFTHSYCIPYNDETKHLLGTTKDCPNKYKTW